MDIFKLTHGDGSQRKFFRGIALEAGESAYIDDPNVAVEAGRWGWTVEQVDELPEGAKLINCAAHPHLRQAMAPDSPRLNKIERGKFRLTAPPGWSAPFCYGFDMRKPFEVDNLDILRRLNIRAKDIGLKQGFKMERLSQAPPPKPPKPPVIEGSDATPPKGGPQTTYSEPKGV